MVVKRRSPGQVAISISMTEEMVQQIDARAASLGLTRSGYLAALARKDVAYGGDLTLKETSSVSSAASAEAEPPLDIEKLAKIVNPFAAGAKYGPIPRAKRPKAQPSAPDSTAHNPAKSHPAKP